MNSCSVDWLDIILIDSKIFVGILNNGANNFQKIERQNSFFLSNDFMKKEFMSVSEMNS